MRRIGWVLWIAVLASLVPASAEEAGSGDYGLKHWGLRVGVGTDPDQVVFGAHFDVGETAERLRLEPNFEIGLGDDHTILSGAVPVHYRFDVEADVQPYAGGGIVVAYIDRDLPPTSSADEEEVEIGLELLGGVAWPLRRGRDFRLEVSLHVGDIYDAQVMAGWTF